VVATDVEGLDQVAALAIQLLVAVLRIELDVLHNVGLSLANVLETVIIHVEGAFIDTNFALTLMALRENGFELPEAFKWVFDFQVSHFYN